MVRRTVVKVSPAFKLDSGEAGIQAVRFDRELHNNWQSGHMQQCTAHLKRQKLAERDAATDRKESVLHMIWAPLQGMHLTSC